MTRTARAIASAPVVLVALSGLAAAFADGPAIGDDAAPIVEKVFESARSNSERAREYAFHERVEERYFGKKGNEKRQESHTWDVTLLDGTQYRSLIAKNDLPLSEKEQAKEQAKLAKQVEQLRNESPKKRERRLAKANADRYEAMAFLGEITRAFDFRVIGDDEVDGLAAWAISAEPREDYRPPSRKAKMLTKVRGTIWVAKDDYAWVKADITTFENFSWGILFKLRSGAEMRFTQRKVDGEVWMPDNWHVRMRGKAALVVGINGEFNGSYSDFRRFVTQSTPVYANDGS